MLFSRAVSSVGRAHALQACGHKFKSCTAHHLKFILYPKVSLSAFLSY